MRQGKRQRVTVTDVAAAAGVSQPAVSLAFRNYSRQSAATRAHILRVADELGYRPNLLVDSLRTGVTRMVGVMMELKDESALRMLRGIELGLTEQDNVPLVVSPDKLTGETPQINRLLDRRVDGIIMVPHREAMFEEHLHEIYRRNLPLVVVDNRVTEQTLHPCFVGTDDVAGGRLAARHLLDLGHRRLGILDVGDYPQPMHFRHQGFVAEVDTQPDAFVFATHVRRFPDQIRACAVELLKLNPTAVFAPMDPALPELYAAAAELGLRIPHDVSIIGFGDLGLCRLLLPQVTTMHQPFEQIGHTAAGLLLAQVRGDDIAERQVSYPPELTLRASTARPRPA